MYSVICWRKLNKNKLELRKLRVLLSKVENIKQTFCLATFPNLEYKRKRSKFRMKGESITGGGGKVTNLSEIIHKEFGDIMMNII